MVGNIPNFKDTDILRCFLLVNDRISRKDLVEKLELGEGTIRTLLDLLKQQGIVESNQQGHHLTTKGSKFLINFKKHIELKRVSLNEFYPEKSKAAAQVKLNKDVGEDYKLRDIAVKNSADGAIIFHYNNGLKIPGNDKRYLSLEQKFKFNNNDILIVAFSSNYRDSENAALAASLHIMPKVIEALT